MKSNPKIKIAIIGGGAAGIVTAKSAIEENIACDVFESADTLGGVWRPDGLAWDNMRVNISRFTGVFSDFSWEQAFPNKKIHPYPTTQEMYLYLLAYIKHFKLNPCMHLNSKIIQVTKHTNHWTVCWKEKGEIKQQNYSAVVLATGRYQVPHIPDFKGLENFNGDKIHSAQYRSANDFSNKSVLIIGGSFSGTAIASELKRPIHLIRRARWIRPTQLTTDTKGTTLPADLLYSRTTYQPRDYAWFMKHCAKQAQIPEWEMTPETPHASIVSDVYIEKVQQGDIHVIKDEIDYFTESSVTLKSGRIIKIDSVIFCTGYKHNLSYLDKTLSEQLNKLFVFYEDTFHPIISSMAAIGINYQLRGAIFPLIELQARWACAVFSGRLPHPSTEQMQEAITKTSARDGFSFASALAEKLGLLKFEHLLQDDPILYKLLMQGAIIPAQYRVVGFGSNPELAKTILLNAEQHRQATYIEPDDLPNNRFSSSTKEET